MLRTLFVFAALGRLMPLLLFRCTQAPRARPLVTRGNVYGDSPQPEAGA